MHRILHLIRLLTGSVALLALLVALATTAHGFTQNHTDDPTPGAGPILKWAPTSMPVSWVVHPTPVTNVGAVAWIATFKKSMRAWAAPAGSDINFAVAGTTTIAAVSSGDGKNVLFAQNTAWPNAAGILAITHYYFSLSTGIISGTDMEFNGEDFTWSTAFADEKAWTGLDNDYDLQSIMTHELGHGIGFGHSLDNTGVLPGNINYDDNGTPGNTADDQINGPNQNTMDPATLKGETFQRSLQFDDTSALDASYPAAGTVLVRPSGFVLEPDGSGDAPTSGSYTIQWVGQYEGASAPTTNLYYTQNLADSALAALTGATLIAGGLACPTDGSTASYTWTFNNLPAGDYYVLAVTTADGFTTRDLSPGPVSVTAPVLTVTAPNIGGIVLTPYGTYTAAWTLSGQNLGAVRIDLSLDGGASYPKTLVASAPNTGAYSFMVPDPLKQFGLAPQTQCRLRVSYIANPAVFDTSDNNFTIAAAADSFSLLAPNGGEFLTAGAATPVQFNASGALVGDNFRIEFSPDSGATWYTVETNVNIPGPNPRNYAWTVPGAFGAFNLLRVASVNNPYFQDRSDSHFTIGPNSPSAFTVVPGQLTFHCELGGASPSPQVLTVLNAMASTPINGVTTTVSPTGPAWISTAGAPTSIPANSPALFPISIINSFGSAGTFVGNVTLNGSGVASKVIPVTVIVTPAGTTDPLVFAPSSLTFFAAPGSLAPGGQTLSMTNPAGNVQTTVDLTTADSRILVSPGRSTLAGGGVQNLSVLVDTVGYGPGVNKTSTVQANATQLGTNNFAVTVVVSGPAVSTVREKAHASPCALQAPGTGGGGGLWALLLALPALALLRRCARGEQ